MAKKRKAAKKAAPLRTERTRSRAASSEPKILQVEQGGRSFTWHVPEAPHKGEENLRAVFVGGVVARAKQVEQGAEGEGLRVPTRFPDGSPEQQAFADGYHEAARQDGLNLAPRSLTGRSTTAAPKRGKRG